MTELMTGGHNLNYQVMRMMRRFNFPFIFNYLEIFTSKMLRICCIQFGRNPCEFMRTRCNLQNSTATPWTSRRDSNTK